MSDTKTPPESEECQKIRKRLVGVFPDLEQKTITNYWQNESSYNHKTHYCICDSDEVVIGAKVSTQIKNGTKREYLISKFGSFLQAPGFEKAGLIDIPEIDAFANHGSVFVSRWLPNPEKLDAFKTPEQFKLVHGEENWNRLCEQAGQLMVPIYAFGILNRGLCHFVWSDSTSTLTMFDHEESFLQTDPPTLSNCNKILPFIGKKNTHAIKGIKAMIKKWDQNKKQIFSEIQETPEIAEYAKFDFFKESAEWLEKELLRGME